VAGRLSAAVFSNTNRTLPAFEVHTGGKSGAAQVFVCILYLAGDWRASDT